jgi:hypothetical protein
LQTCRPDDRYVIDPVYPYLIKANQDSIFMKHWLVVLLFVTSSCPAQHWEAEVMLGLSGYKGDLIEHHYAFKSMRPAVGVNLKYNLDNNIILRAGIMWGKVTGDDKNNKQADLKARNLNFQSNILEGSLCAEFNLLEPEIFYGYPYIFGGIGVFHFNSYTYDKDNRKTYLRPLSTEGQGLATYPGKKPYSLTQFCMPFGAGWKVNINDKMEIIYEAGYRILFTDYLDDVSTTYIDPQKLLAAKGPKAVELAYRAKPPFHQSEGDQRGNPGVKDWYFFNGIKLLIHLRKE